MKANELKINKMMQKKKSLWGEVCNLNRKMKMICLKNT